MSTPITIVNEQQANVCTLPRSVSWTLVGTLDLRILFDFYTDGY